MKHMESVILPCIFRDKRYRLFFQLPRRIIKMRDLLSYLCKIVRYSKEVGDICMYR